MDPTLHRRPRSGKGRTLRHGSRDLRLELRNVPPGTECGAIALAHPTSITPGPDFPREADHNGGQSEYTAA